jgi:hypothetical protein
MSEKITTAPRTLNDDEKAIQLHFEHAGDVESADPKKPKYTANTQLDDAARILQEAGEVDYSPEMAKRVLRKIDIYVCLPMCLTYFVQQVSGSLGR